MPAPNVFAPNSANCADSAMPVTPAAVAKAAPLIETVDVPETETEAERVRLRGNGGAALSK